MTIKIFLLFIFRQTTRLLRVECEDGSLVAPDQEGGRQAPAEAVQPSHVQARARHPAPRQRQRHHHQRRPRWVVPHHLGQPQEAGQEIFLGFTEFDEKSDLLVLSLSLASSSSPTPVLETRLEKAAMVRGSGAQVSICRGITVTCNTNTKHHDYCSHGEWLEFYLWVTDPEPCQHVGQAAPLFIQIRGAPVQRDIVM